MLCCCYVMSCHITLERFLSVVFKTKASTDYLKTENLRLFPKICHIKNTSCPHLKYLHKDLL